MSTYPTIYDAHQLAGPNPGLPRTCSTLNVCLPVQGTGDDAGHHGRELIGSNFALENYNCLSRSS
ncbi:hypothetical protein ACFFS2_17405 [Streptomyces aurantiacus]|uniref:hypothetical protein n=1 Tax=Streptomyces aurantiacus TaxID=47760 RepID=UPI0016861103|nr:hypothetical protein [Streptomyces aurantiacus]